MTNTPTNDVQIIRDAAGNPLFAVVPFAQYQSLTHQEPTHYYIPAAVVNRSLDHAITPVRAWREHLDLTQEAVAERLGISQSAYAQQENNPRLRKASRSKIAATLGISPEQLDF